MRKFAFSVRYYSPRTYDFIRNKFQNNLPHEQTVLAWYQNSDLDSAPGIGKKALDILRQKAQQFSNEKKCKLVVSLVFDEMSIRQHIKWCNKKKEFVGYVSYGNTEPESTDDLPVASNAIVFMVIGVNAHFKQHVAYHFIRSLDAIERKRLVLQIIKDITECDVRISNTTCDGLSANAKMFELLGASFGEDSMKPSFLNPYDQNEIHVIFDPCHMEKLVRNNLARRSEIFDSENNSISWKYFIELEKISRGNSFGLTHKLNRKHIDHKDKIMNVRLATETLSNSVADAIEHLETIGVPEFVGAGPTVKFIRYMNDLFDIMNTKRIINNHSNQFKSAINQNNVNEIFLFLNDARLYLLSLKVKHKKKDEIISIFKSEIKVGFRGFVVDIVISGCLL